MTVLTDPHTSELGKASADIITVSTSGPGSCFAVDTAPGQRVVSGPGEYELADVLIHGVATASQPYDGPTGTAYVFRLEDVVVCHLGGVQQKLSNDQIEEIGDIDVLLIPVGEGLALDPGAAAEVVSQMEPSVVVPMFDENGDAAAAAASVEQFCREMGTKEFVPQPKLAVTKSSLPATARVVVLEQRRA